MYSCNNCKWEGEELSKKPIAGKCPVCGDNVLLKGKVVEPVKKEVVEEKIDFDLDGDGKVGESDRKVAAKLLGSKKGRKSKK